jgi:hypothetical protein
MKDLILSRLINQKLFLVLLFVCISFAANAQWTFSVNMVASGCQGVESYVNQANSILAGIKNVGIPTKSECESLRQSMLNIGGSVSNGEGGICTVKIVCTPCTGSDAGTPGQTTATDKVSIDGLTLGTAFFSPHPSEEIINWMSDYWVKLISMGMPFDTNSTLSADDVPLTGDINFDKLYLNEMIRFEKPEQGGVVDLSAIGNNKGTKTEPAIADKPLPIMGSAPMTAEDRDRQNLYKQVGHTITYDQYAWNTATNSTIGETTEKKGVLSDSKEYKTMEFFLDKLGDTEVGAPVAFAGKVVLKLADNSLTFLTDATIDHKFTSDEISTMNPASYIVGKTAKELLKESVVGKISEITKDQVTDFSVGVISNTKGYDPELVKKDVKKVFKVIGYYETAKTVKEIYDAPRIKDMP